MRSIPLAIGLMAVVACRPVNDDSNDGAQVGDGGVITLSSADAGVEASGVKDIQLASCDGLGPGTEDCHVRLFWNLNRCAGTACRRLVVYWSGGEQACKDGNYDSLMQRYVEAGFVAACAQPFTTSDEAGKYPYYVELDRMNQILQKVRTQVKGMWTGADLLHAGVSHGGTAPLLAIARGRVFRDQREVWAGSSHTAVVLFDGISNTARLDQWAGQTGCSDLHTRWVARYGDGAPVAHICANGKCYCSSGSPPPHAADWQKDTAVIGSSFPPSPYACEDFNSGAEDILYRFVSCEGGVAQPCGVLGDVIPTEQQSLPYNALSGCTGIVASHQVLSACGHSLCGGWESCGGEDAVAWLEGNGW
jgi:hypothetical protein